MKKRYIFIPIIVLSMIAHNLLFYLVFDEIYPIISFLLNVPFYVILYVYYRESKLITAFAIISIFTTLAYWMFIGLSGTFTFNNPNMRLMGIISFFGSVANMVIGFMILLNANKLKFIALGFFLMAIINFIFASYYRLSFNGFIGSLFGTTQSDINYAITVLGFVYIGFQGLIAIIQSLIIYFFDKNQEFGVMTFK